MAINGIIGTWAGPDEPGTAYVMMHHTIGDVGDGHLGSWGYPIGGMGAVADAIRRSAESFGADGAHRLAGRAHPTCANGRVVGVATRRRRGAARADSSSPPPTRRSRSCARSTAAELPDDFVARHRALALAARGTVKVNVALSELPDFTAGPGTEPHERYTGAIELCHSIDYLERAFQDAREGRAAARPFSDGVHPVDASTARCAPRART